MTKPNDFPQIKESMFVIARWNGKKFPEAGRLVQYLTALKDQKTEIALWSSWDHALTFKSKGEAEKAIAAENKFRKSKGIDKPLPGEAMSIKELKKKVAWKDLPVEVS